MIRKGYNPTVDSYSAFIEADRRTPTGLAGLLRGRERKAGAEQEQRDDAHPLPGPERVAVEVLPRLEQAEVVQVEREVERRHPQHRDAAQRVDAVEVDESLITGESDPVKVERALMPL